MNVFIFDIETVPDVEAGRRLYDLDGLSDDDTAKAMRHLRLASAGTDFLRHHLHRVVAISAVLRSGDRLSVWSLGDTHSTEAELIARFFDGLERFSPQLVSWNGSGFDLPVLHYRALVHGIAAPRYWDTGQDDNSFRFNNYLNRFHERHLDLMDVLAGHQARAVVALQEMATILGFPGKMGMSGDKVWDVWCEGGIEQIRNYCETDVLNTYLVFLRFQLLRGLLSADAHAQECALLREHLLTSGIPHLQAFESEWEHREAT